MKTMIREIVKDTDKLQQPCKLAIKKNKQEIADIIQDLKDTAMAYEESKNCVGLAANQIGYDKRIIIGNFDGKRWTVMINPRITNHSKSIEVSEEGCLSLEGTRNVVRFKAVEVMYLDESFKAHTVRLKGFSGYIAQHEIDHLNGKLI